MKDKFPYFPHTTTEKKWNKELLDNKFIHKDIHPITIEIEHHYPYYGLLDRKGKRIAFFNRHREPIKSHRGSELRYWYKIDINNIKHYTYKMEYLEFQDIICEVTQFYDQSNAVNDEKNFTGYITRLNHMDEILLEVSLMQQRFALTIKKAYELKKENDSLNIENKRLMRINKCLHHIVAQDKIADYLYIFVVNPARYPANGNQCEYFRTVVKVHVTWGSNDCSTGFLMKTQSTSDTINRTLWKKQDIIGSTAKNGDYT